MNSDTTGALNSANRPQANSITMRVEELPTEKKAVSKEVKIGDKTYTVTVRYNENALSKKYNLPPDQLTPTINKVIETLARQSIFADLAQNQVSSVHFQEAQTQVKFISKETVTLAKLETQKPELANTIKHIHTTFANELQKKPLDSGLRMSFSEDLTDTNIHRLSKVQQKPITKTKELIDDIENKLKAAEKAPLGKAVEYLISAQNQLGDLYEHIPNDKYNDLNQKFEIAFQVASHFDAHDQEIYSDFINATRNLEWGAIENSPPFSPELKQALHKQIDDPYNLLHTAIDDHNRRWYSDIPPLLKIAKEIPKDKLTEAMERELKQFEDSTQNQMKKNEKIKQQSLEKVKQMKGMDAERVVLKILLVDAIKSETSHHGELLKSLKKIRPDVFNNPQIADKMPKEMSINDLLRDLF